MFCVLLIVFSDVFFAIRSFSRARDYSSMSQSDSDRKFRTNLAAAARRQYLARFVFRSIVEGQFIPLYENGIL